MVTRPKRPCSAAGCSALTTARYCEAHAGEEHRQVDRNRPSASRRGYDRRWRKVRNAQLDREPLCRPCRLADRVTAATEVDHIKPLAEGGTHDENNLQSIGPSCHSAKTVRETGFRPRW